MLEEENTKLKDKLTVFKNKLTEATNLIENLTEQLFALNNESSQLKGLYTAKILTLKNFFLPTGYTASYFYFLQTC